MAIASVKLSLATWRGRLAGVAEQARFLASPVTGPSGENIALGSDLRAVALMNLGIVEASLGLADAECNLLEGAVLPGRSAAPTSKSDAWLRVLRYLTTNLFWPEIASELSISLNTVGTHVRRIYANLGADDRS